MTIIVRADAKSRIPIRGTEKGREYMVTSDNGGWWVMPMPKVQTPKRKIEWAGSKKDLSDYLQETAAAGLELEPSKISKQKVGPCRF